MSSTHRLLPLAAACLVLAASVAHAQPGATKDIVLDRIHAPVAAGAAAPVSDAMAVSVLVESLDGSLRPRPTSARFKTGERFRVKVLPSRDGRIALYNTTPDGRLGTQPVWQGTARRGLELVTPRLRLEGTRGTDLLHVVLEPTEPPPTSWLASFLGGTAKDIRLDTQDTATTTYLLGNAGKGLVTTLRITHR